MNPLKAVALKRVPGGVRRLSDAGVFKPYALARDLGAALAGFAAA
jgi:hypothetical protein